MACDAQMAESVDALVSNTSGFTSIPVRPRVWVHSASIWVTNVSCFFYSFWGFCYKVKEAVLVTEFSPC